MAERRAKGVNRIEREVTVPVSVRVPIEVRQDRRGRFVARSTALGVVIEVRATGQDFAVERCERAVARAIARVLAEPEASRLAG